MALLAAIPVLALHTPARLTMSAYTGHTYAHVRKVLVGIGTAHRIACREDLSKKRYLPDDERSPSKFMLVKHATAMTHS